MEQQLSVKHTFCEIAIEGKFPLKPSFYEIYSLRNSLELA